MGKQKEITYNQLNQIKPVTDSQKLVFDTWKKGQNQFLFGCAGTGKTFVSLYLGLSEVLRNETPYDKVIMVRSLIPTREIGFLPGDEEDKAALYQVPYSNMMQFMFEQPNEQAFETLYNRLKGQGSYYFLSTSFLSSYEFTITSSGYFRKNLNIDLLKKLVAHFLCEVLILIIILIENIFAIIVANMFALKDSNEKFFLVKINFNNMIVHIIFLKSLFLKFK